MKEILCNRQLNVHWKDSIPYLESNGNYIELYLVVRELEACPEQTLDGMFLALSAVEENTCSMNEPRPYTASVEQEMIVFRTSEELTPVVVFDSARTGAVSVSIIKK